MRENEFEQQEITSQEEAVEMASKEGVYFSILRDGPETIEIEHPGTLAISPNHFHRIPDERIFITGEKIGIYKCADHNPQILLRTLPFESYIELIENGQTENKGHKYTCETLTFEDPNTRERFLDIVKKHAQLLQEDF